MIALNRFVYETVLKAEEDRKAGNSKKAASFFKNNRVIELKDENDIIWKIETWYDKYTKEYVTTTYENNDEVISDRTGCVDSAIVAHLWATIKIFENMK